MSRKKEKLAPITPSFSKKWIFLFCLIIIALTACLYAPSLSNEFVSWDDDKFVYENPVITSLAWENIKEIFTPKGQLIYIPLSLLTYQFEYFFVELDPYLYHLNNLILHMLNCLLLMWVVYLLCQKKWVSFFAALIFAVHPLHVESVVWVTERRDVLSTLFYFGALISYIYYRNSRSAKQYILCLVLFILALLSKPMSVTLPLILFLIDFKFPKPYREKYLIEKLPFFALSLVFGFIALSLQEEAYMSALSNLDRILVGVQSIIFYLEKLFVPLNLSAMYPFPETIRLLDAAYSIPLALFSVLILLTLLSLDKTREIYFGITLFLVTLAPTLAVTTSSTVVVAADRYMYLPSVGIIYLFCLFFVYLNSRLILSPMLKKGIFTFFVLMITSGLSYAAYERTLVWKNSEILYNDVLSKYPRAIEANNNMGVIYQEKGLDDKAIRQYEKTLELDPNHANAYNNLANMYVDRGEMEKAEALYEKSKDLRVDNEQVHYNLATLLKKQGKFEKAIQELKMALQIDPNFQAAYNLLGVIYNDMGRKTEAMAYMEKSLELNPNYAIGYHNLGKMYYEFGDMTKAKQLYLKALEVNPNYSEAYYGLGQVDFKIGNFEEAHNNFSKAITLAPENPAIYNDIAIVYVSEKKLDLAIEHFNKAIEIDAQYPKAYNNLGLLYIGEGKNKKAEEQYRLAIEKDANYAEAYFNLALALEKQEQTNAAIEQLIKATEINPQYADAFNNLGSLYAKTGKDTQAKDAFRSALRAKPTHKNAAANLRKLEENQKASISTGASQRNINPMDPNQSLSLRSFGIGNISEEQQGRN